MTEQQLQTKILKLLNNTKNCWAIKAESVTRGTPDIIACYKGKFLAIEVKAERGKASPIQQAQLRRITKARGTAIVAYSVEAVEDLITLLDMEG